MQLNLLIVAIAVICPLFLGGDAIYAQQSAAPTTIVIMESQGIRASLVDAPVVSGSFGDPPSSEGLRGKKWVEIAFDFKCEDAIKGYIDEIKFKISVEGREFVNLDDTVGVPVVLTGDVTFINVPAKTGGSKNTGYFFIHPSAVDRYGGREGRGFQFVGAVHNKSNNNIRIEAEMGGQPVVLVHETGQKYIDLLRDDEKWVDQCKAVPHQVVDQNHSPWACAWADSTLMFKPAAEGN